MQIGAVDIAARTYLSNGQAGFSAQLGQIAAEPQWREQLGVFLNERLGNSRL
jgi:hypothetical protein